MPDTYIGICAIETPYVVSFRHRKIIQWLPSAQYANIAYYENNLKIYWLIHLYI